MGEGIAAVVLNYRKAALTVQCLKSLDDQIDYALVVDNSDNKRAEEALCQQLLSLQGELKRLVIEWVNPSGNLGFGRGIQYGVERIFAKGRYRAILIINNDAVAQSGMVESMLQQLDRYNGRALIGLDAVDKTDVTKLWYQRYFALVLSKSCAGAFPYLSGACLLVSREVAEQGLFDPDFFMYGEDVEFSWRMARLGMPLVIAEGRCKHPANASSCLGSLFYEYHVVRGHIVLANKLSQGTVDRVLLYIGRFLSLPLRATIRCFRYRSFVPWSALILAVLGKAPGSVK